MRIRWSLSLLLAAVVPAQQESESPPTRKAPPAGAKSGPRTFTEFPVPDVPPLDVDQVTKEAIAVLLTLQEGEGHDQWPYQGVYREDRSPSPVGYRVGGTSITCLGLLASPGFREDAPRREAFDRGLRFVLKTLDANRMKIDFIGQYDVRGWGHIYALQLLLSLQDAQLVPKDLAEVVEQKTAWLVQALVESAIPQSGGWNYSRPEGYLSPGNTASTFMTAPALQALFHAKARGQAVPDQVVTQALDALERARTKAGGYAYGAPAESLNDVADKKLSMMHKLPSAAARAAVCEVTLLLAGRGDAQRLEAAVDLFFAHWDDLAVRKSQTGTHIPPYGIAPYYFLFGHVYAAQAIEFVADGKRREELRTKLRAVLAKSREVDGSWNDRQFERSGGYGTALALLTLHMPHVPKPAKWSPSGASADAKAGEAKAGDAK